MARRADQSNLVNGKGAGVDNSVGYWGELSMKDCKVINEACRKFWMKRGFSPPEDFGYIARPRKQREIDRT